MDIVWGLLVSHNVVLAPFLPVCPVSTALDLWQGYLRKSPSSLPEAPITYTYRQVEGALATK